MEPLSRMSTLKWSEIDSLMVALGKVSKYWYFPWLKSQPDATTFVVDLQRLN